jgi:hypothetical protein
MTIAIQKQFFYYDSLVALFVKKAVVAKPNGSNAPIRRRSQITLLLAYSLNYIKC